MKLEFSLRNVAFLSFIPFITSIVKPWQVEPT